MRYNGRNPNPSSNNPVNQPANLIHKRSWPTIVSFLLLACLLPASAAVRVWTGNISGYWNDAGNWGENVVPVSGDTVEFLSTATRLVMTNNMNNLRLAS